MRRIIEAQGVTTKLAKNPGSSMCPVAMSKAVAPRLKDLSYVFESVENPMLALCKNPEIERTGQS